jgi:hypothetical protein
MYALPEGGADSGDKIDCSRSSECSQDRPKYKVHSTPATQPQSLEGMIRNSEFAGALPGPHSQDGQVLLRVPTIDGFVMGVTCSWRDFRAADCARELMSENEWAQLEDKYGGSSTNSDFPLRYRDPDHEPP